MIKKINWNKLRDMAHETSVNHGFYDNKPSNIHFLCLIVSELMEAVEADRKNNRAIINSLEGERYGCFSDKTFHSGNMQFKEIFEEHIKNTLEDELADVVIRCLDLAGANGIDLPNGYIPTIHNPGNAFTEKVWYISGMLTNPNVTLPCKLLSTMGYCFQLASDYSFDLVWHIEKKMMYNSLRAMKHGKRY
nr:MAG TPA: hypothetical protein [Caudoviricetes sp.]